MIEIIIIGAMFFTVVGILAYWAKTDKVQKVHEDLHIHNAIGAADPFNPVALEEDRHLPSYIAEPKPFPQTLGDLIKEETPAPQKPKKPRQKKVKPSPAVLAVYEDPKPVPTEVLDHRLDGYATPPKPVKDKKPKAKVKKPEAWPFPTGPRPDDAKKAKARKPRKPKAK